MRVLQGARRTRWCEGLLAALLLLAGLPALAQDKPALAIDAAFPGGNILVEKIEGDRVFLRPDLRDTAGAWFYWCFRAKGAAGRTITFQFTKENPIGVRGAAVSLDGRKTWRWLADPATEKVSTSSFTYAFPADATAGGEVYLSFAMTYTQEHLDAFLKNLGQTPFLRKDKLCDSKKGRAVERLHLGKLDGQPAHRVLVTARHHACEMMASYAVEGIIQAVLADDPTGNWFRQNVEVLAIPFVDKDGVEDGDQGKNRKPRDHNRDYEGTSIHPETAAIRALVPDWSAGKLAVALDMHCPHIRGATNEIIYQVGSSNPDNWAAQQAFGKLLEKTQTGPLVYKQSNDIPFGKSWNTAANYKQGMSSGRWFGTLPGIRLAGGFELPYANASGKEVNQETARAFGKDVARTIKAYLEEK